MHPRGVFTAYTLKDLIDSKSPLANRIDRATRTQINIITSRNEHPSPDETYQYGTPKEVDDVLELFVGNGDTVLPFPFSSIAPELLLNHS